MIFNDLIRIHSINKNGYMRYVRAALIPVLWACFALTFPLCKFMLGLKINPLTFLSIRLLTAGALLWPFCALRQLHRSGSIPGIYQSFKEALKDWWLFVQIGFLHVYLAFVPELWALQGMSPLRASILWELSPFASWICALAAGQAVKSWKNFLGIFLGILGTWTILCPNWWHELICNSSISWFTISYHDLLLIGAMFSAAYAWFAIKKALNLGYSMMAINSGSMLFGGFMCSAHALLTLPHSTWNCIYSPQFWIITSLLIILSNVIGYNLYGYLLRSYSPTLLSLTGFLCPFFTLIFAYAFGQCSLQELLEPCYLYGLSLAAIGVYLFWQSER